MRSTAVVAFTIALIVAGMGAVRAGEVEYDVITESLNAFQDSPTAETAADVQPYLDDALELVDQTGADTYCETYAASVAFLISTYQMIVPLEEYESLAYAHMMVSLDVVYPELDAIANRCLEE